MNRFPKEIQASCINDKGYLTQTTTTGRQAGTERGTV